MFTLEITEGNDEFEFSVALVYKSDAVSGRFEPYPDDFEKYLNETEGDFTLVGWNGECRLTWDNEGFTMGETGVVGNLKVSVPFTAESRKSFDDALSRWRELALVNKQKLDMEYATDLERQQQAEKVATEEYKE